MFIDYLFFLQQLVASNEKLEASIKSRESEEFSARESLSQGNQCDLLTEYYEEQLQSERNKNRQLLEENSTKHKTIEHLSATIDDLKQSQDNQMSILREEIQSIRVEADKVPKLICELDECHRNESELQAAILRLEEECSCKLSEAHCENQKLQKQHLEEINLLSKYAHKPGKLIY
jgi:predicted RNase H-like nuclease (RuvC/YqgF family)